MEDEPEFRPDNSEIRPHGDGKQVKLAFLRDDGERREVVLDRAWLPQLLNSVMQEITPGQAVQIDKDTLRPGQDFAVQGWQCRKLPEGGARIVFFIDLPDQGRVVTLPLTLSPAEVTQLVGQLTK